ncbi:MULTISPECIES: DUF6527 family protein [Ramlibacter]|uniref:DUF6527 family protein n=1 Tax=Ramlibacter TaxID=174951 RepID=UPI001C667815|nr:MULTISPECIES: DUF6527 family protein [Ramlibacter]
MGWWQRQWLKFKERAWPYRRILVIAGDGLPSRLPARDLVLLTEDDEPWSVAMICPCGCGQRVELPLLREASPRWSLQVDKLRRPTLRPSVWLLDGCRSHYFVRSGRVVWV